MLEPQAAGMETEKGHAWQAWHGQISEPGADPQTLP